MAGGEVVLTSSKRRRQGSPFVLRFFRRMLASSPAHPINAGFFPSPRRARKSTTPWWSWGEVILTSSKRRRQEFPFVLRFFRRTLASSPPTRLTRGSFLRHGAHEKAPPTVVVGRSGIDFVKASSARISLRTPFLSPYACLLARPPE